MTEQNQQPEMQSAPPKKQRRVGTVAFGLTLVAAGVLLVAKTFVPALRSEEHTSELQSQR